MEKIKKYSFWGGVLLTAALWIWGGIMLCALVPGQNAGTADGAKWDVTGTFAQELTNRISPMVSEAIPTMKVSYRLNDSDLVAPEPDPQGYLRTQNVAEAMDVVNQAEALLDGQATLFSGDTAIKEGSTITCYRDDTILALTWKEAINGCCYTFAEVKIADASQMRRFLADGKYNSGQLYTTTEMATSINAVVASSGDYYGYRTFGVVVNEGHVYRGKGLFLDTCYIDDKGDLLFTYAKEILDEDAAQAFVDANNVRFSLSFGPVMVLEGKNVVPTNYNSGEINKPYSRAALCQLGSLHYLVVTANSEDPCYRVPTVTRFADVLVEKGIPTAYALDGGQTATIVMDDQVINTVSYGSQREISDIFYFATAIPSNKEVGK